MYILFLSFCSATTFNESGFLIYQRQNTGVLVLDSQWIVPFNRDLLVQYQCHMNIEVFNQAWSIKYLFKYRFKGPDRATIMIQTDREQHPHQNNNQNWDEIKTFLDGRYVCDAEATHRIYGFDVHHRIISVERLPVHLSNEKLVTFKETNNI